MHKNDTDVGYITNRPEPTQLDLHTRDRGCTGISNSPLAEPYPKVVQGEESMRNKLGEWDAKKGTDDELVESMMDLLSCVTLPLIVYDMLTLQSQPAHSQSRGHDALDPCGSFPRWQRARTS